MAGTFSHVEHVHARACVAQMGPETYALIMGELMADAEKELLDVITMNTLVDTNGTKAITFKYRTSTVNNVLNDGDWFVMFETGEKVAMNNSEYEVTFIPVEGAFADHSYVDEARLGR